jgi:hypothetical protein
VSRGRFWTLLFLALVAGAIVAALVVEAESNPSFRPGDYDSFEECVDNIPAEWRPGSLEHMGAQESCGWLHLGRRP